jgi:hypothetical protein
MYCSISSKLPEHRICVLLYCYISSTRFEHGIYTLRIRDAFCFLALLKFHISLLCSLTPALRHCDILISVSASTRSQVYFMLLLHIAVYYCT